MELAQPLPKRKSMPEERTLKSLLLLPNSSVKVVFLPELLHDPVKSADAMDTSLRARNSTSTSENSRPRRQNKSTKPTLELQ